MNDYDRLFDPAFISDNLLAALEEGEDEEIVCDFCNEGDGPYDDVVTQVVKRSEDGVVFKNAHGQCAIDFDFELG